jgi:hypothetical protein
MYVFNHMHVSTIDANIDCMYMFYSPNTLTLHKYPLTDCAPGILLHYQYSLIIMFVETLVSDDLSSIG